MNEEQWKKFDDISDELFVQIAASKKGGPLFIIDRDSGEKYSDEFATSEEAALWLIDHKKEVVAAQKEANEKRAKKVEMKYLKMLEAIAA